ncbi:hypothetical protein EG327_004593 [Venturia inaequalis]|uniref:Cell cycle control protein cwf19 n=1 Tax=Venturia inaequalis TaxID=5025 RepID=A0A8H3ZAX7_VENIN|nr:hypothetical protein EG327_004593 [Venturia inaequalis]
MGLSDFERELAQKSTKPSGKKRERSRSRERHHKHSSSKRHHREHSSRHHDRDPKDPEDSHSKHRRSKHHRDEDLDSDERSRRKPKEKSKPRAKPEDEEEDEWVEKGSYDAPPNEDTLDDLLEAAADKNLTRQSWMEAPSAMDVDYVQRRKTEEKPVTSQATQKDYQLKMHKNELNTRLLDNLDEVDSTTSALDKPAEHEVDYTFGDDGAQWRMTKLKAVYRQAEESEKPLEEIAEERFGDLRSFDDAREEEIEIDRRKMYGPGYVGKIKPSGELFEERKLRKGIRRGSSSRHGLAITDLPPQGTIVDDTSAPRSMAPVLDQTALNKLKAQMMKAKLKKDPKAAQLEAEYNEAAAAASQRGPGMVVLNAMDNRMLAGSREGEVIKLDNKRGRERGLVKENEDMSIEEMVKHERRTKNQGEGMAFAERIAKDAKFDNDLDYMDDNAAKLAKHVQKSEINLKSTAIGDYQKMNRILDNCPLCHHEDKGAAPAAPVVSLATRVYMTIPTEPELVEGGACIVPLEHRTNLMECDDDEWEEIRNFMKSLTRMYHDQGRDVIFYENAAAPHRKLHAALQAVPLPYSLGETAPAFFREAILTADEEWTQHKKLIDTLKKARDGLGKQAFRRTLSKEMPYFHVWFELDGGLGHIVEDFNRWPKGDLFAREVIGGMLDLGPDVIKRQGRWHKNDRRVDGFRKRWRKFDWTRILTEG